MVGKTIEDHNPALVATGLSLWGLTVRTIAGIAITLGPTVVNTADTPVDDGSQVQALATKYSAQLATAAKLTPATSAALTARPNDQAVRARAVGGELLLVGGTALASTTSASHASSLISETAGSRGRDRRDPRLRPTTSTGRLTENSTSVEFN